MKQGIKKIIAREGLIIITLLLLGFILFFLDDEITSYGYKQKAAFISEAQILELYAEGKTSPDTQFAELIPLFRHVAFPKETDEEIVVKTLKEEFPGVTALDIKHSLFYKKTSFLDGRGIARFYDIRGNRLFYNFLYSTDFKSVALFFWVLAYPLYLLVIFIIWAIKTLRTSREGVP